MTVKPIPDGYPPLAPALSIEGAAKAIDWYVDVLGAKERMRFEMGDRIGHAELEFGSSVLMLADEFPEMGVHSPKKWGGSPVNLMLYVEDVDTVCAKAEAAGATVKSPPENQFYGDRSCHIEDPFGHMWTLATHVEDVSEEDMAKRAGEAAAAG